MKAKDITLYRYFSICTLKRLMLGIFFIILRNILCIKANRKCWLNAMVDCVAV